MKKLITTVCLAALVTGAFAQGTIKFANTSSLLISYVPSAGVTNPTPAYNAADATTHFYYAVLSAPLGTTDPTAFTFAGVYATNTGTAGRLQGGSLLGVAMNTTWGPAVTRSFEIVGWSGQQGGPVFNPLWITTPGLTAQAADGLTYWGTSMIASGQSGGIDPVTGLSYQALVSFSGSTISQGFLLTPVPEPATMALAGLGAAALLIFRRRK